MRDIKLCHPTLQAKASQLVEVCNAKGLKIGIGETLRTVAEQDALYAQGRTKAGSIVTNAKGSSYSSYHQWGTAFDFYRNDGTGAYNEAGNFFSEVGKIGVSLGLEWGGNWKSLVDKPHFQLPDWGSSTAGIKKQYANPDEFKKTWTTPVTETPKDEWQQSNGKWWYRHADGSYMVNGWELINDKWYYFDGAGWMMTGFIIVGGEPFYLDESGAMATTPVTFTPDDRGVLRI